VTRAGPITVDEALRLVPDSEFLQPEGRWVSDAYTEGKLDPTTCLYLIAYLLHRVNNPSTTQARIPLDPLDGPVPS